MASIKLTKEMRRSIRDKVIERRFAETEKALREEAVSLCSGVALGLEIKGDWPKGWFKERDKFCISVEGLNSRLDEVFMHGASVHRLQQNHYWEIRLKEAIPVPYRESDGYPKVARDSAVWPLFEDLQQRIDAFFEERDEAREKMTAILAKFSTTKSLLDAWPELEPFVPKEAAPLPPALPIYEMNKLLGLPVEGRDPVPPGDE